MISLVQDLSCSNALQQSLLPSPLSLAESLYPGIVDSLLAEAVIAATRHETVSTRRKVLEAIERENVRGMENAIGEMAIYKSQKRKRKT